MKKVITGASLLVTGALLFLSVSIVGGSIIPVQGGWDQRGRFWNAVSDANIYPVLVISIIAMIAGIAFLIWGNHHKSE